MSDDHAYHPNHLQVTILRMLCVGHTDRCIARALQLSERTIRDHINRLSTVAQTRGRFALGAEAAWRGWVGRNDVERRT